jgi:hypothetical protein
MSDETGEPAHCQAIDPQTGVHCEKEAGWRADKTDGTGSLLLCADDYGTMKQVGLVMEGGRL